MLQMRVTDGQSCTLITDAPHAHSDGGMLIVADRFVPQICRPQLCEIALGLTVRKFPPLQLALGLGLALSQPTNGIQNYRW